MNQNQNEGNANQIEEDVEDRCLTARNIELMEFISNCNTKGDQSGNYKTSKSINVNVGSILNGANGSKRKDKKNGEHTVKGDMEKTIRVKSRHLRNGRGIGQQKDSGNIENRKNGQDKSHEKRFCHTS